MREIKCRGKYITEANALYPAENKWIYGYLLIKNGECWINDVNETSRTYRVERESVGQYTGLKDKNGKEVYEGDIIENTLTKKEWVCPKNEQKPYYRNMKRKTKCEVTWDSHWACWEFTKKIGRGELEIIGNIYENPELLEN